jgi:hypothetical protein
MSLNRQDATQKNDSDGTARPALQGLQLHSSTGPVKVGTNAEWVSKATSTLCLLTHLFLGFDLWPAVLPTSDTKQPG